MHDLPSISEADLRLSRLLGSGRHGAVFLATSTRPLEGPDRELAIKMPAPHVDTGVEYDALVRFDHPNIVQVRAARLCNGALVLEACERGTLADLIEQGPLAVGRVREVLRAIGSALEHVHAHGWIHGDVTPANIAFRADGSPVLLDFATARPADALPVDEGTVEFTGPLRAATPELDLRSLAATGLCALGAADHDPARNRLRISLQTIVDSADAGDTMTTRDLRPLDAASGPDGGEESHEPDEANAPRHRASTAPFGPPPVVPVPESDRTARSRVPAIVGAIAVIALLAFNEWWVSGLRPAPVDPDDAAVVDVPALETLSAAGFRWDMSSGTLHPIDGDADAWRVGRAGDLAAIGDWTCTGRATLGVYRPASGSWFVFDAWDEGATSAAPAALTADASLLSVRVSTDPDVCDRPLVRPAGDGSG